MSEFALGFLAGSAVATGALTLACYASRWADVRRHSHAERRLSRVEFVLQRHQLMCGAGFPCSGGRNCTSDHK